MAGYDLMEAGRSPAEIRKLEARRKRMEAPIEDRSVLVKKTSTAAPIEDHSVPKKVVKKKVATRAKFGEGPSKTIMHKGRSMANVTADQLKKTGLKSTAAYMRRWKELGKRPTKATATPVKPTTTTTTTTTVKPAVSSRGGFNTRRADGVGPTTSSSGGGFSTRRADGVKLTPNEVARLRRVAEMKLAQADSATRRGPPKVDPQANPNTRRGPAPPPTPKEVARLRRVSEVESAERNSATRRGTRNLGGSTRASEVESAERNPATRRGTSRDNVQSRVDRAKRTGNQFVLLPEMLLKKGGVVKAPKKSIDGIARKGKTRAKHR
jgi:hypothetical protein